jgi:hypothetical protein
MCTVLLPSGGYPNAVKNILYLKAVSWLRRVFAELSLRRFGVDTVKVLVRLVVD